MNKKVMAIAMAVVMLMVAVTVGVSVQSDTNADPIVGGEKIIMGSSSTPYSLYMDQADGVDRSIEFNESAFSSKKNVSFKVNGADATPSTSAKIVKISNSGSVVTTDEAIDITISSESTVPAGQGTYKINFKGVTSTEGTVTITIQVLVQDYVCSIAGHTGANHTDSCIALPTQAYNYIAYVKVIDNTGKISLSSTPETGVIGNDNKLMFQFEIDANITASVMNQTTSNIVNGYKFYATGLPIGISMTVDGKIGGKVSNSYSATDATRTGTYSIYAVSESGKVISTLNKNWEISAPSIGDFKIMVKNPANAESTATFVSAGNYIVVTEGDEFAITIGELSGEVKLNTQKISYNGTTTSGESFNLDNGMLIKTEKGTGTFEIIVEADMNTHVNNNTVKTVHVVKSVTVYVVGKIVDADLDPSVTSN